VKDLTLLQELQKLIECVLHDGHSRWRTQSRHSTQTGRQFESMSDNFQMFLPTL
jgi:hypothetical protein